MKVGFYRCISLLLAVAMCVATSGCVGYHFVSSDYTTSDVEPVSQPKKLLYIARKRTTWTRDWDPAYLDDLRRHLATTYPTVFSEVQTSNTIDVTLNIALTHEPQLEFLTFFSTLIFMCNFGAFTPLVDSCERKYTFFLSYDYGEDIVSGNSPIRTPAIKGSWDDTNWCGGILLPWAPLVGWLFFPFYDYRYSTDEGRTYYEYVGYGPQSRKAHCDIYAALCMASFNKAPTVFDGPEVEAYRLRKDKEARERAPEVARKKEEEQRQALEDLEDAGYRVITTSPEEMALLEALKVQVFGSFEDAFEARKKEEEQRQAREKNFVYVHEAPDVEGIYRVRKEEEAREKALEVARKKEEEARERALEVARKKKEAQRQALEDLVDYYIVRQRFDAQTNTGTCRVQFKNKIPEGKELVQRQKDLLEFCYTKLRENNLEFDSRYVSVFQEDYRAIGKSLKLYDFTIKLGTVECLGLQYDNATLLGSITIRLPGGNPEDARKWVTENLDRLVEEYNISADNPIDGEYQLLGEEMSDGKFTVKFEVVN